MNSRPTSSEAGRATSARRLSSAAGSASGGAAAGAGGGSPRAAAAGAGGGSPRGAAATAGVGAVAGRHSEYGAVPAYLKARQVEWAAADAVRAKAEADKDVPRGMRLMPDAERTEMLAMLSEGIAETGAELAKFKLNVVVPSQLKRRADLEAKLSKMEDAVSLFSKTRVFVKLDA